MSSPAPTLPVFLGASASHTFHLKSTSTIRTTPIKTYQFKTNQNPNSFTAKAKIHPHPSERGRIPYGCQNAPTLLGPVSGRPNSPCSPPISLEDPHVQRQCAGRDASDAALERRHHSSERARKPPRARRGRGKETNPSRCESRTTPKLRLAMSVLHLQMRRKGAISVSMGSSFFPKDRRLVLLQTLLHMGSSSPTT